MFKYSISNFNCKIYMWPINTAKTRFQTVVEIRLAYKPIIAKCIKSSNINR